MGSADRVVAVLALLAGVVGLASGLLELCRTALELRRARREAGTGTGITGGAGEADHPSREKRYRSPEPVTARGSARAAPRRR